MSCACSRCCAKRADLLSSTKDLWLKLTGGRPENLPKLKQNLSAAAGQDRGDRRTLVVAPRGHAGEPARQDRRRGAFRRPWRWNTPRRFFLPNRRSRTLHRAHPISRSRVEAMVARLDAAQQNKPIAGAASAPLLDEMARRAQERLLLAQVAREIQANLRHIEQVLDAFSAIIRSAPSSRRSPTTASRSRARSRCLGWTEREQLLVALPAADRRICEARHAGRERGPGAARRIALRVSASTSRRSSSSGPTASGLIEPLLAQRLGIEPARRRARTTPSRALLPICRSRCPRPWPRFSVRRVMRRRASVWRST